LSAGVGFKLIEMFFVETVDPNMDIFYHSHSRKN
jgi:hypothetical protein